MAKQKGKVYLGYEEEIIKDKNLTSSNYSINKIGGFPDWPPLENLQFSYKCPLCGLHRVLIVQCYAPIEKSVYHRTLYLFACLNPNCWIQSESWICVRSQFLDESNTDSSSIVSMPSVDVKLSWCSGADEWDENDNGDTANGNFMNIDNDNALSANNGAQRISDDDESNSYEVETVEQALGNLQVYDSHNANTSPIRGAIAAIGVPVAAAELEGGDEPGLVIVDTPTMPARDIETLLHQTAELPQELRMHLVCGPLQFIPKYVYVEEEWKRPCGTDDGVMELLSKYKKENEIEANNGPERIGGVAAEDEIYEEAVPLHGDRLFHTFLTRLRSNPGQILRYSREEPPLLGAPLNNASSPESSVPTLCARCGSTLICELQLLPAFAQTLQFPQTVTASLTHLHFLSVLIFTCSQSCWQPTDAIVKETVVFQPEVF